MNREQRRRFNLSLKESKVLTELANMAKIKKALDEWKPIPEGAKVKLNIKRIKSDPDWEEAPEDFNKKRYVNWINRNADKMFTVEYDPKYGDKPTILCLKEDDSKPFKWLFWEGDLIVLEEDKK
jgi:hypothetical protein